MPKVSIGVELSVEVDPASDPISLEEAIAAEGRRAARELYSWAVHAYDEAAAAASGGTRKRLEPRWVTTLFGRVRIRRYRVKMGDETFHPVDQALGLERGEPSPALRKRVRNLARRLPYREVAQVMTELIGEPFSYETVSRIVRPTHLTE